MGKRLRWRVQSGSDGGFDELVVTSDEKGGCLVHAEMMSKRSIFVSVGELRVWAHVDTKGVAHVTMIENDSGVDAVAIPPTPVKGKKGRT